jgi:DNA polymerase (family 10)
MKAASKMSLSVAEVLATKLVEELQQLGFAKTQVAGSIRRKEKWIGDIDLIVDGDMSLLSKVPELSIFEGGKERVSALYKGQQVNFFRSTPGSWGAALFYVSGPSGYHIGYRMKAKNRCWVLNQHGLFDEKGKLLASATEEEIYKCFGKEYKAPEKRGKR